jgi:hypothetical protein
MGATFMGATYHFMTLGSLMCIHAWVPRSECTIVALSWHPRKQPALALTRGVPALSLPRQGRDELIKYLVEPFGLIHEQCMGGFVDDLHPGLGPVLPYFVGRFDGPVEG